jgi:hypothetical protein
VLAASAIGRGTAAASRSARAARSVDLTDHPRVVTESR